MTNKLQEYLENKSKSQFTNKSYNDFRQDLLNYAKEHYSENILDFSEVSIGGMFLDFAAIVGDSLNFYTDQQMKELNYETATNRQNINSHLRRANIKNNSAYPSSAYVTFSIEVQKSEESTDYNPQPNKLYLPVIKKGTELTSISGVNFVLEEDVDFRKDYDLKIGSLNEDETVSTVLLSKEGLCTSGTIFQENVYFTNDSKDLFLSYELEQYNVTDIISIVDEDLNVYHEVEHLSQGTIYDSNTNEITGDDYLIIKPATYRFVLEREYDSGKTIVRFGNGKGKQLRNNVFQNTSDLTLPYKNKTQIENINVDPSLLLQNNSFGISPKGKDVTITYKAGGGIAHNVDKEAINKLKGDPIVVFPNLLRQEDNLTSRQIVLNTISIKNKNAAIGGASKPTINELKYAIPLSMKSQSRIVTHEDLLARILSMPNNFGKIEKAVALDSKYSSLSKDLFIICKDKNGHYVNANDAVKINLSKYINQFRLISDNYNIFDVPVYNFSINLTLKISAGKSIEQTILQLTSEIINTMIFQNMQIGEPINVNNIIRLCYSNNVTSILTNPKDIIKIKSNSEKDNFFNFSTSQESKYSDNILDPVAHYIDGFIYPPRGGIFELKYPTQDINIIVN